MKQSDQLRFSLTRYYNVDHMLHYLFGISVGLLFFLVGVTLFTISCDSNVDSSPPILPHQDVPVIEGLIRDHADGSPVPNVSVSIDGVDSTTAVSDSLGYYYILGPISPGEHEVIFTAPDFMVKAVEVYISNLDEIRGDIDVYPSGDYHYKIELDVELYRTQ